MSTVSKAVIECPYCKNQLQLDSKLSFASGPKNTYTANEERVKADTLQELLDLIDMDTLEGDAYDFVSKTRERFSEYGEKTRMSPRQMKWLKDLAKKEF